MDCRFRLLVQNAGTAEESYFWKTSGKTALNPPTDGNFQILVVFFVRNGALAQTFSGVSRRICVGGGD